VDYAEVAAKVGADRARAWYGAYDQAVDAVERIVREESIDCGFARRGKLKLATRPQHLEALARSAERLVRDGVDSDVEVLSAPRVQAEVASDRFVGGLLYKRSGQMHMGRFALGLAQAAERHGAQVHVDACVQRLERLGRSEAHRVHTSRGVLRAQQVLLANGAARHGGYGSFGWLRRRIVPIGSFIVVTEPLGAERAQALLRSRRTYVTVANVHHYFRLSDDHRLVFGGRARFAVSSPVSDAKSGEILRAGMIECFPSLRDAAIDYCWGGLVDMTADRLPRAGLDSERPLSLLVTCHRRESWGDGLRSIAAALTDLAGRHLLAIKLVLHPNPAVASVMRELLPAKTGVRLLEPLTHEQMIKAMLAGDIILSDSGGMQEEAPALGIPLLVLREKTERPEGVASGNMLLVGTDRNRIVAGVERLLDPGVRAAMSRRAFPYGDGHSAERIAGHIADYLMLEEAPVMQFRQV